MTSNVRQILLAAAITIVLFMSGFFVFLTSIPTFFVFAVLGRRAGWLTVGILASVAAIFAVTKSAMPVDIVYFAYFLTVGVILGVGVERRVDFMKLGSLSVLIPWAAVMFGAFVTQYIFGYPLLAELKAFLTGTIDATLKMQETAATLRPAQLAYLKNYSGELVDAVIRTSPAALLLFCMAVTSISILLMRSLTRRFGVLKYFGNVAARQFPFWPVWITIVCGGAFFIDAYFAHNVYLKYVALNGLIACAGIYFIHGCFVVSFWLHKGRSPIFRLFVYGLIIVFLQVVGFLIIALGVSDHWLDFRRKHAKNSSAA